MYAMIFEDGMQMTLTYGDIYSLGHDKTTVVTGAKSNGAQTVFTVEVGVGTDHATTWQVIANRYSEGEHALFANRGRNA